MKKTTKKLLFMLIVFSAFVTSCYNDVELDKIEREIQIDQALVTPVGTASISADVFITRLENANNIYTNPEGVLEMRMDDKFEISFRDIDLLSYAKPFELSGNIVQEEDIIPPHDYETYVIETEFTWDFGDINSNINNERIDVAAIETLTLDAIFNLNSIDLSNSKVTVELTFADHITYMTGEPYTLSHQVNSFGTTQTLNFEPVKIRFTENNGTPISSVPINAKLTIENLGANELIVPTSTSFNLKADITAIQFEYLEGHFEASAQTKIRKYDISLVNDMHSGTIRFKDPIISLKVENSFGVDLDVNINNITFTNKMDPSINVNLQFPESSNPDHFDFNIPGPTIMGEITNTRQDFDKTNTNIREVLAQPLFPSYLELNAGINTANNNQRTEFIHKDSKFSVEVNTIFPFIFEENSEYVVYDTITDINITLGEDMMINENSPLVIDTALIVLNITNGMPLKATFEPIFYDAAHNVIDFDTKEVYTIEAPKVSSNGLVESVHEQRIDIRVKNEHIKLLESLSYMVYKMEVNTDDIETANIQSDDYIEVRAGVYVRFDSILKY